MIYTKTRRYFCFTSHERKCQNIFTYFGGHLIDIFIANEEGYSYRGNLKLFDFTQIYAQRE